MMLTKLFYPRFIILKLTVLSFEHSSQRKFGNWIFRIPAGKCVKICVLSFKQTKNQTKSHKIVISLISDSNS